MPKVHPLYVAALKAVYTVHDLPVGSAAEVQAALAAIAPRITGLACGGESNVNADLLAQLPAVKMLSVFGVGYDGVDAATAVARGIPVSHTPEVLTDDVADLAIALMLGVARNMPQADQFVRTGQWPKGPMRLGRKVSGTRMGIVGLGRIGNAIAKRGEAFGMSIAYTTRTPRTESPYTYYPSAAALAAQVDFLVVITPGGAATRHLINAEVLRALGKTGYLINVARGSVVDEAALIQALTDGTIAGAGLDVFADEPNVPAALMAMSNVTLTPHMASATVQTRQAMADLAFANMQAGLNGQPLLTPVPEYQAVLKAARGGVSGGG
jgi:hydroxypyruvate reductase